MKNTARALCSLLLASCIIAQLSCTETIQNNNSYIIRLKNRGYVPLSKENPYIAGNMLLNKEMERSPEIKGFIDHSGAPSAIRIEQGFFSPLYIEFYYPAKSEYFSAEESNGAWLINGPYQMDKSTIDDINKILIISSTEKRVELPAPAPVVPALLTTPTFSATATAKPTLAIPTASPSEDTTPTLPTISTPADISLQSLTKLYGKSNAEITPKGDVVHYVSYPGETISMLARWYTFDSENQQRIMRINHITSTQILNIGDSIVIPSYLIKNKSILTQEGLAALEEAVSKGAIK